jgi:transcriptional regulator with XRE-family HTH domain
MSITKVFNIFSTYGILVFGGDTLEFGEMLYSLRKKHKLSQKQLADELEVAQASINYWEKGERTPSIDAAKKISDYFGVSVNDMINGIFEQNDTLLQKETVFLNYLLSLGYEYVDTFWDNDYGYDRCIHIKSENKDIPLTPREYEDLKKNIKKDIEQEIERLRQYKHI